MDDELKQRIEAVLKHFPRGTPWVFRRFKDVAHFDDLLVQSSISDDARWAARDNRISVHRIGGDEVFTGIWLGSLTPRSGQDGGDANGAEGGAGGRRGSGGWP